MRAVLTVVTVGVAIYALVDCLRSRPGEIRWLPKAVWVVAIVLMPLVGSLVYLFLGRTSPGSAPPPWNPPGGRRFTAPDDDPEFLRSLDSSRPRPPENDDPDPWPHSAGGTAVEDPKGPRSGDARPAGSPDAAGGTERDGTDGSEGHIA